jgi:DNA repair protein SbcC/Rad50
MSILVDGIRVAAFGGICAPIELDLSAPLTLIYAPNGTGKTSLIESVDWVFGGEVRAERCKLATDSEPTEVTLSACVNDEPISAKRSIRNGKTQRLVNGVSAGEAEFLRALAPDCDVSELSALARIPRLKAYLSSNRVLGVDSLSRLIDGNNADSRADALADLAGTRAQRNAQKLIDIYRNKLRDSLSKQRAKLSALQSRQREFRELSISRTDVDALVSEAARLIYANDANEPRHQPDLALRANSELGELNAKITALNQLRALITSRPEPGDLEKIDGDITALEAEISELHLASETEAETSRLLTREVISLEREAEQMQRIADALLLLQSTPHNDMTLSRVAESSRETATSFVDLEHAKKLLLDLSMAAEGISADIQLQERLQHELSIQRSELNRLDTKENLAAAIALKKRSLDRSEESRRSLKNLRNEAARAALQAHSHQEGESTCPACGHDWGSHSQLRLAIDATLSALPFADAQLLAAEAQLAEDLTLLQNELMRLSELEEEIARREADLANINSNIDKSEALARRFGFERTLDVTTESLHAWKQRLQVTEAFQAFADICLRGPTNYIWSPDRTPAQELSVLLAAIDAIKTGIISRRREVEAITSSVDIRDISISQLANRLTKQRAMRDGYDAWIRQSNLLRNSLGLTAVVDPHLDEIETALLARQESIFRATELLRSAGEIQTQTVLAQEADQAEREALCVEKQIATTMSELDRIDFIDRQIETQSERHLQLLIETIGPSVSQLFQRMQVNRVFESVTVSPSLQLQGLLSDYQVEPELFSTGQRQDLAIAFFLVRAYALGGSFFLDEPLAHLDDLNRVAVLDTLRAFVLSGQQAHKRTRLVITTASWTTTRHVIQKFMRIQDGTKAPLLKAYQLTGNVSSSVSRMELFPAPNGADVVA